LAVTGSERLDERARTASGARFGFVTDAESVSIAVVGGEDSSAIDLVVDGILHDRRPVQEGAQSAKFDLPAGVHEIDIWLPQFGPGLIGPVDLDNFNELAQSPPPALRWGAYGSSITQCRTADGPSETWPAIVSQSLNWELSNMGFGGECMLDPIAATTLRDAHFDIISLCLGINIYLQAAFNARSLQSAICGFVSTVRAANPATPIVMITPIISPPHESLRNAAGLSLGEVRATVERATAALQELGDELLTLVDGRELIGTADATLLLDDVHPSADGYRLMAARIMPFLSEAGRPAIQAQGS
jgi:hypothetical protein